MSYFQISKKELIHSYDFLSSDPICSCFPGQPIMGTSDARTVPRAPRTYMEKSKRSTFQPSRAHMHDHTLRNKAHSLQKAST
jgi:hypothetical protein